MGVAAYTFAVLLSIPTMGAPLPLQTAVAGIRDVHNTQIAQESSATPEWQPTPEQVREIQQRLQDVGFDPGATDGVLGKRTTAAVKAYQRSINVEADGQLSEALYTRLTTKPEEGGSPAAATAPGPVTIPSTAPTECSPVPSGDWKFDDAGGSSFALTLQNDGTVSGPSYPQHWRWRPTNQGVQIAYDNGMGLTVSRNGILNDADHMIGQAMDSRGRSWDWTATRLAPLSQDSDKNCKLPGSP